MIVLDTNVLSEVLRPNPAASVGKWMGAQVASELFTTAITEAEVLFGVAIMADGRRRSELELSASRMFEVLFAGRILPFNSEAAKTFAEIVSARRAAGRPMGQADAQIAAIARSLGATVATRDIAGFANCGVALVDPWSA
jgi:predicted nucleic acid-binding protein